jgi:heptosyltransferase-2
LPNSFRSALIPFLARIPERIGRPGHARAALLTRQVKTTPSSGGRHQSLEYFDLLLPGRSVPLDEHPQLNVPDTLLREADALWDARTRPRVALLPGAARGPSKRWPAEHYSELGKRLRDEAGCAVAVFGSPAEAELCGEVAVRIGGDVLNLAGQTTLPLFAAALKACDGVVANDSGGMHVAAAVGTPLVALYGHTDPETTGPLGPSCTVLQHGTHRSRDIARNDVEARESLAAMRPEEVYDAVLQRLPSAPGRQGEG